MNSVLLYVSHIAWVSLIVAIFWYWAVVITIDYILPLIKGKFMLIVYMAILVVATAFLIKNL